MPAQQIARFGDGKCEGGNFRRLHQRIMTNGPNVRNGRHSGRSLWAPFVSENDISLTARALSIGSVNDDWSVLYDGKKAPAIRAKRSGVARARFVPPILFD
jgi:hypothetical protein